MKHLFRLLITFVSGVSALYFVFWVGGAILLALHLPLWLSTVMSLAAAAAVSRYVWIHTATFEPGLISSMVLGAFGTGGVGSPEGSSDPSSSCRARIKGHCSVSLLPDR